MIFRYNFDLVFMEKLASFAKINEHLNRSEYKEKWEEWLTENKEDVEIETRRLETLGYTGNINGKMYKSARYYFRTKVSSDEPKKRRNYVSTDKKMLDKIDEFLREEIQQPEFTPQKSYERFSCDYDVPKKTFKNRYFLTKTKAL